MLLPFLLQHLFQPRSNLEVFVLLQVGWIVGPRPYSIIFLLWLPSSCAKLEESSLGRGGSLGETVVTWAWDGLLFGEEPFLIGAEGRLKGRHGLVLMVGIDLSIADNVRGVDGL